MTDTDVDTEHLAAFGREHGIPALLDHLGLDEFGNEVSRLAAALRFYADPTSYTQPVPFAVGEQLPIERDLGCYARAALAVYSGETPGA